MKKTAKIVLIYACFFIIPSIVIARTFLAEEALTRRTTIKETASYVGNGRYVTYEEFGAIGDGKTDDYTAIKKAHEYANKYGYDVKAKEGATYHIFMENVADPIYITTNTNWNGSTFIIHDENLEGKEASKNNIFYIGLSDKEKEKGKLISNPNFTIGKQTKKIPQLAGNGNAFCFVYNKNKMQYKQYNGTQSNGVSQREVFKIDNEGNVLNDILWDYDEITTIQIWPIPENNIIIENGKFQNNVSKKTIKSEITSYYYRNIICNRSNTTIQNVTHTLSEDIGDVPYYGFINIKTCADVELNNCELFSHKYIKRSCYDLIIEQATNIKINNVTSNDINNINRWGITGTNFTKDITYQNCKLNRIDAHSGVHNLTIENCEIGVYGITVVGSGKLTVKNSKSSAINAFIDLRSDFGSTWDGDIEIIDSTYTLRNLSTTTDSNNTTLYQLIRADMSQMDVNNANYTYDFGYDRYFPNVYVENFTIDDTNVSTQLQEEKKHIYIIANNKLNTGLEDGQISKLKTKDGKSAYKMPQTVTIKNYKTLQGKVDFKMFYNEIPNNINTFIDVADREELILKYESENGTNYTSGIPTCENIYINMPQSNRNTSKIKINGKEIEGNTYVLSEIGNYEIIVETTDKKGYSVQTKYNAIIVPLLQSTVYDIQEDEIKGISERTTIENMCTKLSTTESLKVKDEEGKEPAKTTLVGTGMTLIVKSNMTDKQEDYKIVVTGDITGDGKLTSMDLLKLKRTIIDLDKLKEIQLEAADVNQDGKISGMDLLKIKRMLVGLE